MRTVLPLVVLSRIHSKGHCPYCRRWGHSSCCSANLRRLLVSDSCGPCRFLSSLYYRKGYLFHSQFISAYWVVRLCCLNFEVSSSCGVFVNSVVDAPHHSICHLLWCGSLHRMNCEVGSSCQLHAFVDIINFRRRCWLPSQSLFIPAMSFYCRRAQHKVLPFLRGELLLITAARIILRCNLYLNDRLRPFHRTQHTGRSFLAPALFNRVRGVRLPFIQGEFLLLLSITAARIFVHCSLYLR